MGLRFSSSHWASLALAPAGDALVSWGTDRPCWGGVYEANFGAVGVGCGDRPVAEEGVVAIDFLELEDGVLAPTGARLVFAGVP